MPATFDIKRKKNQHKGVIDFPQGLIGFSSVKRFVLIEDPSSKRFVWLAGVDRPELSFLLTDPKVVVGDYEIETGKRDLEFLGLDSINDAQIYVIVTLPRNAAEATVNLKSPILINTKTGRGMQIVLEQGCYPTQLSLLKEGDPAKTLSKV